MASFSSSGAAPPLLDSMRWTELTSPTEGEGPPAIKNHSVAVFQDVLFTFGGYDGRRNHMALTLYSIKHHSWIHPHPVGETGPGAHTLPAEHDVTVAGTPPPGRNGHTATLVVDGDEEDTAQIIIIGGWLGTGPLAASDLHVLEVTGGGRHLRWYQPPVKGTAPGPCNMHSADFISSQREVYVFRGGNGREYMNDLHALNVDTFEWRAVETTGAVPQQRANHSSAMLEETGELFIFGGWNGMQRLNDIHILDVANSTWTCPHVGGVLPHPRAGMTLTALRGRLFLFGGSGTSSKCFEDLQILDRAEMAWLDVMQCETPLAQRNQNVSGGDRDYESQGSSSAEREDYRSDHAGLSAVEHNRSSASLTRASDWRLRDGMRQGPVYASASPNPNDEDTVPTVLVYGQGPGRRAGHTATAVSRRIFLFGGSCGSDYLNDMFVLDTDPPPRAMVTEPTSLQLFDRRIRHFFNEPEFSDVTFVVEGQKVYGHKMVLSIVSDCFRAMFTTGFRESEANAEIEIQDCSYDAFLAMMEYVYKGQTPRLLAGANGEVELNRVVDVLELADQYFLDHLKQICESLLQPAINTDTVEYLLQVAQKTNAVQLAYICEHFLRNHQEAAP